MPRASNGTDMTSVTNDARAALLRGIIDDASLFPPASLSIPDALVAYHEHHHGRYHALQGRFVIPAGLVGELLAAFDTRHGGYQLSVIVEPSTLDADLATIGRMYEALPQLSAAAFELRLPRNGATVDDITRWTQAMQRRLDTETLEIYVESPFDNEWLVAPSDLAKTINAVRERTGDDALGAKLRCGGSAGEMFPTNEQLATFVIAMREAGVAYKAAGVHQPLAHASRPGHGFLNVLAAALFAHFHAVDDDAITAVLAERDPSAFHFEERHFRWRTAAIDTLQIAEARDVVFRSFASASFDGPVEGLRALAIIQ